MQILLAIVIGLLFAAGIYMLLRRSLVKMILALVLLGHAVNVLLLAAGDVSRGYPTIISADASVVPEPSNDPLPQALVLTAIVIGFGMQAFAVVLFKRTYQATDTDDADALETDR